MSQDDFVQLFTHKDSLSEHDIIDIDDDDDDSDTSYIQSFGSKKKRNRQSFSLKLSSSANKTSNSNSSSSLKKSKLDVFEDEYIDLPNNNNNSNNDKSLGNETEMYTIDSDSDQDENISTKQTTSNYFNNSVNNKSLNNTVSPTKSNSSFKFNNYQTTTTTTTTTSSPLNNEVISLNLKLVGEPNTNIKFYTDSQIQKLIDTYCAMRNLLAENIQLKLFGQILEPKKTPRDYDLMDGDSIDVSIKMLNSKETSKINSILPTISTSSSNIPLMSTSCEDDGNKIVLQVRYDGVAHKFKINKNDPFSKLVSALIKKVEIPKNKQILLKFDGLNLNLSKTPEDEDMEDEDLIDSVLK